MREILTHAPVTPRVADLCATLGVSLRRPTARPPARLALAARELARRFARPGAGPVVLITGPSGGGKSTLLRLLSRRLRAPLACTPAAHAAAVDALGPVGTSRAVAALAWAGLADAGALVRLPRELSEGQRHRLAIARSLARRGRGPLLIDEFASTLDRPTAMGLCLSLARWAGRTGRGVVCATAHEDVRAWLRPGVVAVVPLAGPVEVREGGV